MSYALLQAMAAIQFFSIFVGPALVATRIYMHFFNRGTRRSRRRVTILAAIFCFLGGSQLAFYYYIWPSMQH